MDAGVARLMQLYPRIFHACHTRHVRDPGSGRVLSAHQVSILAHLDEIEPTGLAELASHMGVTPSTMSISVDRLLRAGYIARARDPDDGRRVNLRLSPAGARVRDAESVLDSRQVARMLAALPPADRARALDGLALLADAAQKIMGDKRLVGLRRPDGDASPKADHQGLDSRSTR